MRPLPQKDDDLESFLIANGFLPELVNMLTSKGVTIAKRPGDSGYEAEVAGHLRNRKTEAGTDLIKQLRNAKANKSRVPSFFAKAIQDIIQKAT